MSSPENPPEPQVPADPAPGRTLRSALLRSALALVALVAIGAVFWRIGWPGIRANLNTIGLWFVGLVVLNFIAQAAFVAGLRNVLTPRPALRALPRLYAVYAMGDAANYVAPAGGEALKAHLMRDFGGVKAGAVAITLHKHADLFAQCAFAALGVGVALASFEFPRPVAVAAVLGVLVLLAFLLLMTWALDRGAFGPILRRLSRWKALAARLQRLQRGADSVDAGIRAFHAAHRSRFVAAVAFSFVGYCGGLLETWIILLLLSPSASWAKALAIESLAMVLGNVLLFIPGKLGGVEGLRTGLFVLLGLPPSQGAAYALVRRSRELLWILPGWVLLSRIPPFKVGRRQDPGVSFEA